MGHAGGAVRQRGGFLSRADVATDAAAHVGGLEAPVGGGDAADMLHLGHAPARVALPHGGVHDDDDDGVENRRAHHGGAPGGAANLLDPDLLRGPAVRRGDVVHRAGSRQAPRTRPSHGVAPVALIRRRRRVYRRRLLPHPHVRRRHVHDGRDARDDDRVHRAAHGHRAARQRRRVGRRGRPHRVRRPALPAQGALRQLFRVGRSALVGAPLGAGSARDLDRGPRQPAPEAVAARGARVAGEAPTSWTGRRRERRRATAAGDARRCAQKTKRNSRLYVRRGARPVLRRRRADARRVSLGGFPLSISREGRAAAAARAARPAHLTCCNAYD